MIFLINTQVIQIGDLDIAVNRWKIFSKAKQILFVLACLCVKDFYPAFTKAAECYLSIIFFPNIDQCAKRGQQWLYSTSYVATQPQLPALVGIIWIENLYKHFNARLLLLSLLCLYSRCVCACVYVLLLVVEKFVEDSSFLASRLNYNEICCEGRMCILSPLMCSWADHWIFWGGIQCQNKNKRQPRFLFFTSEQTRAQNE